MSANIVPFDFKGNNVRSIAKDGEIWFVAKDICHVLELSNVSQACSKLEPEEINTIILNDSITAGNPEALTISESGMYALVLKSRKPQAKAFRVWVTSEVLPTIRKTGSYSIAPQPVQPIQQLAPQRDLKDWVECMAIMGLTEDPILKSLVSQRMAEQIGGTAPEAVLPKCLTVLAGELGISQREIGDGSKLGKYIVARGFVPIGKTQHGKYLVNAYDRTSELDRAILEYFDAEPIAVLGGSANA